MAGSKYGPRPGWEKYPQWKRDQLEKQRRQWHGLTGDAKVYAKLEAFKQAHKEQAYDFFADKMAFVGAMFENLRDEEGQISPDKVAALDAKDKKVILDAVEKIEKTAGFQQQTTVHKHDHEFSLSDRFVQLQGGAKKSLTTGEDDDVIDVEGDEIE